MVSLGKTIWVISVFGLKAALDAKHYLSSINYLILSPIGALVLFKDHLHFGANLVLDLADGFLQGLGDGMALQACNIVARQDKSKHEDI